MGEQCVDDGENRALILVKTVNKSLNVMVACYFEEKMLSPDMVVTNSIHSNRYYIVALKCGNAISAN